MFLSRKALLEKNGQLQREVDRLRKQLTELSEEKSKTPANCTPGEWCKACEHAYVEQSYSPFGGGKIATCTRDRCARFSPAGKSSIYPSSLMQMLENRKEPEE